jgi:phosphate-selective porin OprO/OprP
LLWYENEGEGLLHVGMSGKQATGVSQAGVNGRLLPFRTRDAIRTGLSVDWPQPAAITLYGDDLQQVNMEMAAIYGPWTFQAEYLLSSYQDARTTFASPTNGNAVYHGGYIQLLRFLTNDHDHYSKKTGFFERVKPTENFFLVRDASGCRCFGTGAWQVGARYNYLDLNDNGLNGGILHNMTTGVNWFLNPNMKLQFDYIATYRDAALAGSLGDGWIHGWGMRFAHDF